MSHSQWEKKKYKKAHSEGKTSQIYAKLVKLIIMEAKKANGNRDATGLKQAILKARAVDMPSDNIDRAIKKATEAKTVDELFIYEGYGKGGVGFIVEVLTDSRNRASQEMRHLFDKHSGALGAVNSVSWSFDKIETEEGSDWKPNILIPVSDEDRGEVLALLEDLENNEDVQEVYTNAENLE